MLLLTHVSVAWSEYENCYSDPMVRDTKLLFTVSEYILIIRQKSHSANFHGLAAHFKKRIETRS